MVGINMAPMMGRESVLEKGRATGAATLPTV